VEPTNPSRAHLQTGSAQHNTTGENRSARQASKNGLELPYNGLDL